MSNVTNFVGATKLQLPVERVLTSDAALALTEVLVIGWTAEGKLHFAMSDPGLDRALMLLACAEQKIIDEVTPEAS
jgi:hypothetical protein